MVIVLKQFFKVIILLLLAAILLFGLKYVLEHAAAEENKVPPVYEPQNVEDISLNTQISSDEASPESFLEKIKSLKLNKNDRLLKNDKFRIILGNDKAYLSETQSIIRIFEELKSRDIEVLVVDKTNFFLTEKIDFDLFVAINPIFELPKNCKKMLIFHYPYLFENARNKNVDGYDGYLSVVPDTTSLEVLKGGKINKTEFYISCRKTKFCDNKKAKLFYCGKNWDARRGEYLRETYNLLDKTSYTNFYGLKTDFGNLKNLKPPPPNPHRFNKVMCENGIALVVHSENHFKKNITSARIFEAAAASCLIICDELPFIKENFKDSVCYIDINKSPRQIFKQIDKHVKWAHNNPQKAIEKARMSHRIFCEKFTLEDQIDRMLEFYKKL